MPLNPSISTSQMLADGCQLANPPELFIMLCQASGDNPCETGCAYFANGKCPAYQKHFIGEPAPVARKPEPPSLIGGRYKGMTVRQIAKLERISLKEVRRRKAAGVYRQ